MVVNWDTTITVKNAETKECSIQSIRTDDSTTPDTINTINISSALLTSQVQGDKVIDTIYELYLEQKNKETKIKNVLDTYQNYFNNQLNNKEN